MGYLMDQSVMVFDNASDRASTLGTAVAEGMMAYTKDDNSVQVYDGSAWAPVDTTISSINNSAVVNTLTSSTATAYTVQSADQGTFLRFTAAAGTITVGTATDFTAGQLVQVITEGTAWAIIPEGTAVELYGRGTAQGTAGFLAESPYDAFSIISVGTNAYRIIGNVTAVE
jgi:hypothetical protein